MSQAFNVLEKATAHFDKLRGQRIEIPEWDMIGDNAGKFDPPTLTDRQNVQTRAGKSQSRQFALTVITMLKDKGGKPVFEDDAETLTTLQSKVDPKVIARIYTKIMGLTSEEDLGN